MGDVLGGIGDGFNTVGCCSLLVLLDEELLVPVGILLTGDTVGCGSCPLSVLLDEDVGSGWEEDDRLELALTCGSGTAV
jgi:hypothetical protein